MNFLGKNLTSVQMGKLISIMEQQFSEDDEQG